MIQDYFLLLHFNRIHKIVLLSLLVVVISIMAAVGALKPWFTPDTAGYLTSFGWPEMLAVERTPFYRGLYTLLTFGGAMPSLIAVAQVALYIAAGVWFLRCLACIGLPAQALLALGITLLLSNALFLQANWIHPEFPAISFALFAFGASIRFVQEQHFSWKLVTIAAVTGSGAYLLRPSFLPLIIALPLLGLLWRLAAWQHLRITRALTLLALLVLPFLTVSSVRLAVVKDFNIVSFGGFAMSGLAALTLAPETIPRIPPAARPLAEQILAARVAAENEGRVIGIPPNSAGIRSFNSVALGYFDVLARTYDDIAFGIILSHRQPGESWVAFNARMQFWSLSVISAVPERYFFWLAGASTRLAGRLIVTNLSMVIGIFTIFILFIIVCLKRIKIISIEKNEEIPNTYAALFIVALTWLLSTAPLIVFVSFPASRYIDTVAVLFSAPLWLFIVECFSSLYRAQSGAYISKV